MESREQEARRMIAREERRKGLHGKIDELEDGLAYMEEGDPAIPLTREALKALYGKLDALEEEERTVDFILDATTEDADWLKHLPREDAASATRKMVTAYAEKIAEAITTSWLPGIGVTAGGLGLDETEMDQAVIDILRELKDRITDLQREVGREALEDGRFVRFPS